MSTLIIACLVAPVWALTTPIDNSDPLPVALAGAAEVGAPMSIAPSAVAAIDSLAANADFIAACAREAGLAELPCFDRETPAAVMYADLIKRLARRGISEGLRRDFVAFFELFKEREI